jgi:hypothetical protein
MTKPKRTVNNGLQISNKMGGEGVPQNGKISSYKNLIEKGQQARKP